MIAALLHDVVEDHAAELAPAAAPGPAAGRTEAALTALAEMLRDEDA